MLTVKLFRDIKLFFKAFTESLWTRGVNHSQGISASWIIKACIRQQGSTMIKKRTKPEGMQVVCQDRKIMTVAVFVEKQGINCQNFSHIRTEIPQTGDTFHKAYHGSQPFCMILYGVNNLVQAMTIHLRQQPFQRDQLPAVCKVAAFNIR